MVKNLQKEKMSKKTRRKDRVRARILGTFKKPRFSVFRSNYHVWCQLINDEKGETISAASDKELPQKLKSKLNLRKIENKLNFSYIIFVLIKYLIGVL